MLITSIYLNNIYKLENSIHPIYCYQINPIFRLISNTLLLLILIIGYLTVTYKILFKYIFIVNNDNIYL